MISENDALDLLLQWHLGGWLIPDSYDPALARIVTETINKQSELTITLLWDFAAQEARKAVTRN